MSEVKSLENRKEGTEIKKNLKKEKDKINLDSINNKAIDGS